MTRLSQAAARRFYKRTGQKPPPELAARPKVAPEETQDGSDGEIAFAYHWRILAPAHLPAPVREYEIPEDRERRKTGEDGYRVDFFWHAARLIFEVQGSGHQIDRQRYRSDLVRHGLLTMWGYRVIYATPDQINDDPDRWIGILRCLLTATAKPGAPGEKRETR